MSKLVVLSELKKYVKLNDEKTMKGTFIQTLEKEKSKPINQTTELHLVKIGDKMILVPLIKKDDLQTDPIDDKVLSVLLSKIKNQNDRDIVKQYVTQQNMQEVINMGNIKRKEIEKKGDGDEINDETKQFEEAKTKLQKEIKALKKLEDLNKILDGDEYKKLIEDLKENKLNKTSGNLARTINAAKRRLTTKELIDKEIEELQKQTVAIRTEGVRKKKEKLVEKTTKREQGNIENQKLLEADRLQREEAAIKKAAEAAEKKAKEEAEKKAKKEAEEKAKEKEKMAKERTKTFTKALKVSKVSETQEIKEQLKEADTNYIIVEKEGKDTPILQPRKKKPTSPEEGKKLYGWTLSEYRNWFLLSGQAKPEEKEKPKQEAEAKAKAEAEKKAKAETEAKAKSKSDAQKVGKGAVEDILGEVMKQIGKSEKGKEKQDKEKEAEKKAKAETEAKAKAEAEAKAKAEAEKKKKEEAAADKKANEGKQKLIEKDKIKIDKLFEELNDLVAEVFKLTKEGSVRKMKLRMDEITEKKFNQEEKKTKERIDEIKGRDKEINEELLKYYTQKEITKIAFDYEKPKEEAAAAAAEEGDVREMLKEQKKKRDEAQDKAQSSIMKKRKEIISTLGETDKEEFKQLMRDLDTDDTLIFRKEQQIVASKSDFKTGKVGKEDHEKQTAMYLREIKEMKEREKEIKEQLAKQFKLSKKDIDDIMFQKVKY